ncbi:putative polyketide synthase [Nemania abortiva]|nr:putative polyketide synthase [Nemania abortiva]
MAVNGNSSDLKDLPCIVGIGCRLPGGIRSPSELWDFLAQKRSAQGPVPPERFNINGFYHPDGKRRAGVIDADGGYFLDEDVRQFENSFFGINNLEATYGSMDPQQRKLLEVVAECLENAGVSLQSISGTNTAVYVGNFTVDFQSMQTKDADYLHRYHAAGTGTGIMANRISHVFNLHGPSFTLDTACSSALVCLHNAAVALQNGDCDGAIVAGANLITGTEQHIATVKGGVISPTSTCHTFDAAADGYGRAEAVSAIYLKRLSTALEDGDCIRAIVRGTAINANGRTLGITQPSAVLQEAVIRKAYSTAGLQFSDTDYVECHGTGTAVGDPIEVDGIGRCFGGRAGPLLRIGSIKTNLGHSEAASALSSVIKAVLAFEHGQIPPTRGIKKLNPKLSLEAPNIKIVTELEPWPRETRRISINAFGFGGANAHAILESYDSYMGISLSKRATPVIPNSTVYVLPFSTASSKSLDRRRRHVLRALKLVKKDPRRLKELAFTLSERRSHLQFRGFCLADGEGNEIIEKSARKIPTYPQESSRDPLPIVFVFTGQGAQYPGMGKALLHDTSSVFSNTIRRLDEVLMSLPATLAPEWTLEAVIAEESDTSQVHDVARSQPLCTAIQIGLVDILRSWGVRPVSTVGHSSGEIAAAYAAGFLSAREAILVAYLRGVAVKQLRAQGRMMAVGMSAEAATRVINDRGLKDKSVTLSGTADAVGALSEELRTKGFVRVLETNNRAYHSHLVQEVGSLYEDLLSSYVWNEPSAVNGLRHNSSEMISSVGREPNDVRKADRTSVSTPSYWRRNLELPVQFNAAMQQAIADGKSHLIEIGPHAALRSAVDQIISRLEISTDKAPYDHTLLRGQNAEHCIKALAGNLFMHSHPLKWSMINGGADRIIEGLRPLHDLPPYPWDYSAGLLWNEPRASEELRNRTYVRHELLGSSQLAGNGVDFCWRNILKLDEIPWIRDHKVESQIVFPATAYLTLAIEALAQVQSIDLFAPGTLLHLQNVKFIAAFVIEEDKKAELHTSLTQRKISTSSRSKDWYEFTVSSWVGGISTSHCEGSIRFEGSEHVDGSEPFVKAIYNDDSVGHELWTMERWYAKLQEKGLAFGPEFRSLTSMKTDGNRIQPVSISTTLLNQRQSQNPASKFPETRYNVSPVVVDACIQAAIMGGTAGNLNDLKAYLPVFISNCFITTPDLESVGTEARIHTNSRYTGPATKQIDSTLYSNRNRAVAHLEGVHLALYSREPSMQVESNGSNIASQRHPCLRLQWKPDVSRLGPEDKLSLLEYLSSLDVKDASVVSYDLNFLALLDLAGHKNPRMRILTLSEDEIEGGGQLGRLLGQGTAFPRYQSWARGSIGKDGTIHINDCHARQFDVIIVGQCSRPGFQRIASDEYRSLLAPHGMYIYQTTGEIAQVDIPKGFERLIVSDHLMLETQSREPSSLLGREFIILVNKPSDALQRASERLAKYLKATIEASDVIIVSLNEIWNARVSCETVCISLLEVQHPLLAMVTAEEMDYLRKVTDVVSDILWISGESSLSDNPNPNLSLVHGLSRALMLEQPLLRFSILDVGNSLVGEDCTNHGFEATCANIVKVLVSHHDHDDKEFVQVGSLLHISRFVPDAELNELFGHHLGSEEQREKQTRSLAEASPARLVIENPGRWGSMHFQQLCEPTSSLPPAGFVDVDIKAVGINAKDIYTMVGRVETPNGTLCHEFTGVIRSVGPDIDTADLAPGDRVLVVAMVHLHTTERVPAWTVHKLLPSESFRAMATLPVVYATALCALNDYAHLRAGESVLIHAGAGAFGIAAITLAQRLGAIIYTTVSSEAKRSFLICELGVPEAHIFQSRDSSFTAGIMRATGGRGVDVIVNSLAGDLMHESWSCIAKFGRFVEIGKRELLDAGKLDMRVFLRNATFAAFDLSDLYYDDSWYKEIMIGKVKEVLDLFRAGHIQPIPSIEFDVSDISQAYHNFSRADRIGKVIVSMDNPESLISVSLPKYRCVFDAQKAYLLVGCLGGLGRSVARWMMARGARRFVFLGRSGCDKSDAKNLISRLKDAGASVTVVRGDVTDPNDVKESVKACHGLASAIGGVVQAAMGLHEALFSSMTNEAWHTGIQPKWRGSWNLHNELAHEKGLDFFLLTSSVSGSVGTATESNYCAANGFLDAFARWQRQQGIPSISVGLGMISDVGYLHENPDIEALLLRKGIQSLNEDELLQIIDLAIYSAARPTSNHSDAHILTGLEPFGLRKLMARGFDVDNGTMRDPRAMVISGALIAELESRNSSSNASGNPAGAPDWLKSIPPNLAEVLRSKSEGGDQLHNAVLKLIVKRFSDLTLLPLDQVNPSKALSQYGMDSMIAAEFRTWFWRVLKVDVPFLSLLSPTENLVTLTELVETKLQNTKN